VRHAWQQGGDPLIGSNGAVRGMPAGAAAGRRAHCNLWSARAHRRHTYATVLPATIDSIRAHVGNPTQITLFRMPVSAGSLHEKTVHNGGSCESLRPRTVGGVLQHPNRNNASATRRRAGILGRMVTFRRETRLWRETSVTQRALMIRDDADTYWLACQMQHRRITDSGPALIGDPRSIAIQGRIDVDLFIVTLHRLHTVAKLAAEVADPRDVLSGALERFGGLTAGLPLSEGEQDSPATIASVRNAFEHGQNLAIRGGLGLASGPDGWWVSYRGRMFQTKDLLAAAEELHRAVRAAVDPEAFSDFHGDHPFIELRDPADITRPWRPGSEIAGRQAATMARIEADLRSRAELERQSSRVPSSP
jgi:hypothetical protein